MSFRFAAVPPTCLHNRLAWTCLRLRIVRGHTLSANRSITLAAIPHDQTENRSEELGYPRDVPADGPESLEKDELIRRVWIKRPTTETAQSIRQYLASEEGLSPFPRAYSEDVPQKNIREPWPRDWQLEWDKLYTELLDIRSDASKKIWHEWDNHHEFAKAFIHELDAEQLRKKWQALATDEKAEILPVLLAGSLANSAAQTLFVLSNIDIHPAYNFRIRMQCLRHIHLTYPKHLAPGSESRKVYEEQIAKLRPANAWETSNIPVPYLDTLLTWSSPDQCETVIEDFFNSYPFASPEALLPVITSYIKRGNVEKALEYFKRLPDEMLQNPNVAVLEARNRLLKRDTVSKTEAGSNFHILPQVLALGIQPDAALHNAVIEAALANDVPEVAWDVYHHLKSNELEINARSHLVLLRDAFQRGQVQAVSDVMTAIHEDQELVKDPYLIAYSMNIVRNICYFERKTSSREALTHIMALYDRAYNRAPLYRLRILSKGNQVEGSDVLPSPGPSSLAFTIWTFVLVQHSNIVVDMLWGLMKQLITELDQDVIAVARLDIVYNSLILFYARHPSSMIKALQVVQYMLESNLCEPSAKTWGMLLCGLIRHKQLDQAEKLLRLARSRGQKIERLSQEHLPPGYSLKEMAAHIESTLDERSMPTELGDLMAESLSLASSHDMPQATHQEINSYFEGPKVWKGFADMRPRSLEDLAFNNID